MEFGELWDKTIDAMSGPNAEEFIELLDGRVDANTTQIDTRVQTAVSIGAEMWACAGDKDIPEAVARYGSFWHAAKAAADLLTEANAQWIDWDGVVLPHLDYILAYITSN